MVSARSSVTPCATPCATQMRAHRCIGLAQSAQPSPKKLKVLGGATNRIAVEPAGVDKEEEVAINEEVAAAVEELAPLPVYEDGPTRQCPISDPVLLGADFLQEGIELIQSIHSAAGTSPQQKLIPVEVYRWVLRSIGKIRHTCVQIRDRLPFTRRPRTWTWCACPLNRRNARFSTAAALEAVPLPC